jgi:UPF0755 protein
VSDLESKNIIRSPFLVKAMVMSFQSNKGIKRGDYLFEKNTSALKVAWMLARGDHNIAPIKITLREGLTNIQIADILSTKLTAFRRDLFLSDERTKQGYLFPDTYFFFSLTTTDEILDEIAANFKNRIGPLQNDIADSSHKLGEIITMASIVEREAKGETDAPLISGILWKRIRNGMLLQVDAEPSTYQVSGLPRNPIANPGLVSIKAALYPKDSPYLFYLHDKNGMVHYASTFAEHRNNINRYLK